MNVRGVIRMEAGFTKKYVVLVDKSPLEAVISMNAMQQSLGLSTVSDDVVVAAPVDRVVEEPLLGLALKRDAGDPLGAFRVLLLIQGTGKTVVHVIDDTVPAQQQTFKVVSEHVTCLLSESPNAVQLQLVAYCDFDKSLAYRLDKERALVLVSAVEFHEPGTRITATVENMEKISKDEWKALQRAMTLEWRSVLTTIGTDLSTPKRVSSSDQEYWTQSASKLRRLESEPVTPK
jgi:hypothetical protein